MKKKVFSLMVILIFAIATCGSDSKKAVKTDYDVIVIGAGGGGLAAAAKLSMEKKRVLLIEQHSKVGGYMGSFRRGKYTFEISLHSMDGLEPGIGRNIKVFLIQNIFEVRIANSGTDGIGIRIFVPDNKYSLLLLREHFLYFKYPFWSIKLRAL